ncbi:MAG: FAD-dependent thymidylate synthase, partial [Thermoplasmata archaeon]
MARYTPNPIETAGRAAGICWDKEEKEDYGSFIKRVVRMGHESVIEHVSFTFRIEGVSRAMTHQLVRHRIASYSQRSQRYVDEGEFAYVTPPNVESD